MTREEFNQLLRDFKHDSKAAEELCRYCVVNLKLHLSVWLREAKDAEDVAHDIFCKKIFENPPKTLVRNPRAWLFKIADNYMKTLFKTEKRYVALTDSIPYKDDFTDFVANDRLREALKTLDKVSANIIVLYYYYGYTHKEISKMIGMAYGNVRMRSSRAIKNLRKLVTKEYFE